ncbi:AB-hydrolase associated lipase region containing protein [Balamuthia mandrillaris]
MATRFAVVLRIIHAVFYPLIFLVTTVLALVEAAIDRALVSLKETLKALIQEVWQIGSTVLNNLSGVVLGFFHKPSFDNYLQHRRRIRPFISPSGTLGLTEEGGTLFSALLPSRHTKDEATYLSDEDVIDEEEEEKEEVNPLTSGTPKRRPRRRFLSDPSSPAATSYPMELDTIHRHEHQTGFFEDLRLTAMVRIDAGVDKIRSWVHSAFHLSRTASAKATSSQRLSMESMKGLVGRVNQLRQMNPRSLISPSRLDVRNKKEIVQQAGYPYEVYTTTTEDGYILTIERIPNKNSLNAVYFQHGVFDHSFAWISGGPIGSLAFLAHDQGLDVWLGNFRGSYNYEHVNPNITPAAYWDFTINEHAFQDIPAFIRKIKEVKSQELHERRIVKNRTAEEEINTETDETEEAQQALQISISVIAHSMGAATTLMYIIGWSMKELDHGVSEAILLSPAGYHERVPLLARVLGPIIERMIFWMPWLHTFRFPSDVIRLLTAKAIQDVRNTPATRELLALITSKILGGDPTDHPFTKVHNVTYNIFAGTSRGVFQHFLQLSRVSRFQAYDFGIEKNFQVYGTPSPPNFMDNYDKVNIPIHFLMGLDDTLIDPVNILKHYTTYATHKPHLAFLKAFPKTGHLDFTLGLTDAIVAYILKALPKGEEGSIPLYLPQEEEKEKEEERKEENEAAEEEEEEEAEAEDESTLESVD